MRHFSTHFLLSICLLVVGLIVSFRAEGQAPAPGSTATKADNQGSGRSRPLINYDFFIQSPDLGATRLIGLQAESNSPDMAGHPTVPSRDRRYYYLPPISFQEKNGELEISADEDGSITMSIYWDRADSRRIIKDYLNEHHLLDQDADEGQIQIVSARALRIETPPEYTPRIVFGPYENLFITNYEGILYSKAYPPSAKKFVEDLKKGRISLTVSIALEGYDFQQDIAVITFDDVSDTHYYKNLTGPSGPTWISRNQMASVASEAATSRDISVTTEFDDPDFDKLVQALLSTLDHHEEQLINKWKSLDEFFVREGWDPEDFRADLITRSKLDRNSEYSDKFRQDLKNVASDKTKGGGFSLGFFGTNIVDTERKGEEENYNEWENKVVRDVMDKWSMHYEEEGKRIVPKSINVYRNDFSQMRAIGSFRVGLRKKFRSNAIKEIIISPVSDVLHVQASMPFEVRQSNLASQLDGLLNDYKQFKSSTEDKLNNFVMTEDFLFEADYARFGRLGEAKDYVHQFKVDASKWKCIDVIPIIQSSGFYRGVRILGQDRGSDWVSGATTIYDCGQPYLEGNVWKFKFSGRWFDWGDDGRHHVRFRFVGIFVRK